MENYDRLDAIVNNAAQTVRRPPAYYAHLVEAEKMIGYSAQANNENNEQKSENGSYVTTVNYDNNDDSENNDNSNDNNSNSSSSSSSNTNRLKESLNKILHHQRMFSSSLSHAVESAQSPSPLGSITDTDRVSEGSEGGGVMSKKPSVRTGFGPDSTPLHSMMTPAISSSEMTQIILTKVSHNFIFVFEILILLRKSQLE